MSKSKLSRREFIAKSVAGAVALTGAKLSTATAVGANDRLRIGIIGTGNRGGYHLSEIARLAKSHNVQVAAVCDTWRVAREQSAAKVREAFGSDCAVFSNYQDLLSLESIDAVVIATPDFSHCRILTDALNAGKHAYCEKPMATELSDAILVLETAQKSNCVVQIGTQRRSEGKWRAAAKMVQSGILGTISRIEIAWNDSGPRWNRGFSDLKEEDVDWKRFLMDKPYRPFDPSRYRRWQLYRDYSLGVIGLLGSHYIDVVCWIMDDPLPKCAVALGGNYVWRDGREHEDTVYVLYEFPKGFICRYLSGLGNSAESGLRAYGTRGTFSESTWTFTGSGGGPEALKEPVVVQPEKSESHMANWLECIRTGCTPNAPIELGYNHSVACIMGYQALLTGRKMRYLSDERKIVPA
ncbi:MAG: Gfo/Idh/MocA family oxidoreductase [Armatimonadota bacterium]|nr:Gfo/Idh/MocA family oxidoreductase [Armatimonadota bacterium]